MNVVKTDGKITVKTDGYPMENPADRVPITNMPKRLIITH